MSQSSTRFTTISHWNSVNFNTLFVSSCWNWICTMHTALLNTWIRRTYKLHYSVLFLIWIMTFFVRNNDAFFSRYHQKFFKWFWYDGSSQANARRVEPNALELIEFSIYQTYEKQHVLQINSNKKRNPITASGKSKRIIRFGHFLYQSESHMQKHAQLLIEYTCVCVSLCMHKHTKYALCNSLRRCIQKIRSKCVRCLLSHCYEILVTWFDHQFAKWFSDYILIISDHFI